MSLRGRGSLPTIALLVALLALGVAGPLIGLAGLQGFIAYHPPYDDANPSGRSTPPLADHVVLVVVDGLRYDASLGMPYLNELRRQGADFISQVGQPSLSLPGWTALGTGAGPEISGVTTNWYDGPTRLDSVLAAAKRAGLKTAVVGDQGWRQLYGAAIDVGRYSYDPDRQSSGGELFTPAPRSYWDDARNLGVDDDFLREGLVVYQREAPNLLLLYFSGPDQFGHGYGAASQQYAAGVAHVDGLLRQLVAGVDLRTTAIVVTADHGHVDRGGHGGPEPEVIRTPLVLVGRGVAPARAASRTPALVSQQAVAPTVAALLGAAIPAQSQAAPLLGALALPAATRSALEVESAEQRNGFALAYARQLGVEPPSQDATLAAAAGLRSGHYAQAAADAEAALADLDRWQAAARAERLGQDRLARLPVALAVVLVPLAYALLVRPRRETLLALPIGVAAVAALWLVYLLRGYGLSLGTFNQEVAMRLFLVGRAIDAATLTLVVGALVGLAYHRAGPGAAARLFSRVGYWVALLVAAQLALFYVLYGAEYRLYLPDMQLALKAYLDLLQLAGVGMAAVPGAGLAAALAALAARALPSGGEAPPALERGGR